MRLKSCGSSNSYGEVISPMCYYLAAFRPRLQSTFSMKTEYSVWLFNVFEYVWTSSGKWKYRKLKSFTVLETFWWVQNFVCSVYYYDRDRSCMSHCSKISNYVQKFNFEKLGTLYIVQKILELLLLEFEFSHQKYQNSTIFNSCWLCTY